MDDLNGVYDLEDPPDVRHVTATPTTATMRIRELETQLRAAQDAELRRRARHAGIHWCDNGGYGRRYDAGETCPEITILDEGEIR